jgi:integrase
MKKVRERGEGGLFREKYRDRRTGEMRETATWMMKLYVGGKPVKKSSGETKYRRAIKALEKWKQEVSAGSWTPDSDTTTFRDLAAILTEEYKANARRSADRLEFSIGHLRGFFQDHALARAITPDRVIAYVRHRQEQKAANATINRELAALKRMLRLGEISGKVARRPHIAMLEERNVRSGFFEPEQFRGVVAALPDDLKAVAEAAYITGWRIRSELLTREWKHVDFAAGWIRLEPGETKNQEGRMFPLTPDLRAVLERQRERTAAADKATDRIVPWVFHRSGKPIKDFRGAWRQACKNAGSPGRIPHDFRRTAVRGLERAGVSRSVAMKMVGHLTESVYRRYAIAAESDLREGARKLQALHDRERPVGEFVPRKPAAKMAVQSEFGPSRADGEG